MIDGHLGDGAYEKSTLEQLEELQQSLLIIRDLLEGADTPWGDYKLLPIYAQLRALLIQKTNGTNDPLLFRLAKKFSLDLKVFRGSLPSESDDIPIPPDLHISFGPISSTRVEKNQIQTTLDHLLKDEIVKIRKEGDDCESLNLHQLICYGAEVAGGAHFDRKIKQKDYNLERIRSCYPKIIGQLSALVLNLGGALLKQTLDYECFIGALSIPSWPRSGRYILIRQHLGSGPYRVELFVEEGFLGLYCCDFKGRFVKLTSDVWFERINDVLLHFRVIVDSQLRQRFEILLDGKIIVQRVVDRAVLVFNDLGYQETVFNPCAGQHGAIAFSLSGFQCYAGEKSLLDACRIYNYLLRPKDSVSVVEIKENMKGVKSIGECDLHFEYF